MRIKYEYAESKKKPTTLAPICKKQLEEAIEYIAINSPKEAEIMSKQFFETRQKIERMPTMGALYKNGMRKMKLGKFSYYVYYREKETFVEILGIHHIRRGTEFAG